MDFSPDGAVVPLRWRESPDVYFTAPARRVHLSGTIEAESVSAVRSGEYCEEFVGIAFTSFIVICR